MERIDRLTLKSIEDQLQAKYRDYFLSRWEECISKRIKIRLVVDFDNGKVTAIQDQAIITGSSVLDFYTKKMLDIDTTE